MSSSFEFSSLPPDALLAEIKARLEANPYFLDIPVLLEDDKDVEGEVERALAGVAGKGGAAGVFVLLSFPDLAVERPNLPGPEFSKAQVSASVCELPAVNRGEGGTGKTARAVACEAARTLHHFRPAHAAHTLVCSRVARATEADMLVYDVAFDTGGIVLPAYQPPNP